MGKDFKPSEGPDSCWDEWLSYIFGSKRELTRCLARLMFRGKEDRIRYFCLNAGGCGSKYLVHLLRANEFDHCYHEKAPDFDRTGVQYFLSGENKWTIKILLLLTRNRLLLESSNRLFSLAPVIKEVFPNSKFIHLHRNGVESVRSVVNKVVWPGVMERSTRLRYASGLAGEPMVDPFDRMCHYWSNINERIYHDLKTMDDQDVMSLKFGDLIRGNLDELESFLGRTLTTRTIDPVNTKQDLKDQSARVIGDFEEWPEEWQRSFVEICGPIQDRLRYDVPEVNDNITTR